MYSFFSVVTIFFSALCITACIKLFDMSGYDIAGVLGFLLTSFILYKFFVILKEPLKESTLKRKNKLLFLYGLGSLIGAVGSYALLRL